MQYLSTAHQKKQVICLMAPTASGKTALAYQLYETGKYELISVDSALVYRDMDIGTAKPSAAELEKYPHYLVDIIDPTQSYSVADFVNDVERLIDEIHARGRTPLLIGGTMMYYMALFEGLSNVPNSDPKVREEVEAWRQQDGIVALYTYLNQVDPVLGERLKPNDTQRISRAIEVYKQTGKPLSYWQDMPKVALADNPLQTWIGLIVMPDRAWLHQRIARRLDIMWQEGLVDEVLGLIKKYPLTATMASMRCVGYRQVLNYLYEIKLISDDSKNEISLNYNLVTNDEQALIDSQSINGDSEQGGELCKLNDKSPPPLFNATLFDTPLFDTTVPYEKQSLACQDMINQALYATRQLAKRQYTWLRKFANRAAPFSAYSQSPDIQSFDSLINDASHAGNDKSRDIDLSNNENKNILITFESMSQVEQYFNSIHS